MKQNAFYISMINTDKARKMRILILEQVDILRTKGFKYFELL